MTSCEQSTATTPNLSVPTASNSALATTDGPLSEVNTPESISRLAPSLEKFQPQVQILSPKSGEILSDDRVTVKLQVNDLPLFKHPELGLGNHLHVILDKQTYQGVYDLNQPLVFKNLAAGTHSLRVFASRAWHESFKNEGAYAQATFHVLTKTAENNPDPQQPLLTYSRPAGIYSAEPIMLDYYLTNAPSHLVANGSQASLPDWRIRVTVNDQRFILDRWAPIYLQGFKQGKNWVRLELVDDRGNPMPNVYNDTVGMITYDPQNKDTLAKLIRGEINPNLAQTLVDPNYVTVKPTPPPISSVAPIPIITPAPIPAPILPSPIVIAPPPVVKPSPSPVVVAPIVKTLPIPSSEPFQTPALAPIVEPSIDPTPTPAPVVSNPPPEIEIESPLPAIKPSPVAIPTPEVVKNPIEPVLPPKPSIKIVPTPIVTPKVTIVESPQPRQIPAPVITPVTPTAQIENKDEKTWQTQASDLLKVAGVKIRAFTNTIPAKAQRFGQNVQMWAGNAIDKVQEWRTSNVE
ncbi:hypothetical protein [Chamaesiphon sp. VAR_48_metabat_135_sub]|uniref:hypothetical protein n=1 Tax=Chamaesiphon sp. VAR_48_metabat_135_sub TaxID=2964699 RepID=UPI00286CD29E|nr:hypothetical protein [Chamaesiphon sp. VAR_48_metabat_135_sub]